MEIRITINDRLIRVARTIFNRQTTPFFLALVFLCVLVILFAEPFVIPFIFKTGEVISSSQMNENFSQIGTHVNALRTDVDALTVGGGSLWVSSGNDYYVLNKEVGIGTSTPSSLLHMYSNTGDAGITVESANVSYDPYLTLGYSGDSNVKLWRDVSNQSLKFNTGGATCMTINSGGQIGIGTTGPGEMVHIYSGSLFLQGGKLRIDETATGWPYYIFSNSENLYIEKSQASDKWVYIRNTYGSNVLNLSVDGDVSARGVTLDSDARLKENIQPIENALDRITAIDGVSFTFKGLDEVRLGVVAQNVRQSTPEAVRVSDESTGYLGVDYLALVPVLIEAVKELKTENKLLKQRLDELEKTHIYIE